ncbi:MAG: Bug family tripartite tricarboxylate transporter substrate binding protein [Burkholderiaceae bacterium]
MRNSIRAAFLFCAAMIVAAPAVAQTAANYPSQPVKLLVPFPPGGGADVLARMFGQRFAATLGQPFVVENKPGAGTLLAVSLAAQAPADGYTLITATADMLAVASALYRNPIAVPEKELTPIGQVVQTPLVLVVRPDSPYKSLGELLDAARKTPGKLTYGSAGIGTIHHLAMELLMRDSKTELRHIAYKGSSAALGDLLGGHVDVMFLDSPLALGQLKASKVRPLAVSSAKRLSMVADIPTVAEQGFTGYEALSWMGFAAPRGTPKEVLTKVHGAIRDALATAEVQERLRTMGVEAVGSASPEAFDAYATRERQRWGALIKSANIELMN